MKAAQTKPDPAKSGPPFVPVPIQVTAQLREDGGRQKTLLLGRIPVAHIGDDVEATPDAIGRIVDAWAAQQSGVVMLGPRDCTRAINGGK